MISEHQIQSSTRSMEEAILIGEEEKENRDTRRPFLWNRVCPNCGAEELIPAGSCHVCRNCGVGSGCS